MNDNDNTQQPSKNLIDLSPIIMLGALSLPLLAILGWVAFG